MQEAGSRLDALPARLGGHYERRQMGHRKHGPAERQLHAFDDVATIALPRATKVDLPFPVFRSIAERVALVVSVNNLSVANVHLDHGQIANRRQLRHLVAAQAGIDVVVGDFNAFGKHAPGRVRGCRTATADALRQRPRPGGGSTAAWHAIWWRPGRRRWRWESRTTGRSCSTSKGWRCRPTRARREPSPRLRSLGRGASGDSTASAASNGRRMEGQEVRLPGTWPSA